LLDVSRCLWRVQHVREKGETMFFHNGGLRNGSALVFGAALGLMVVGGSAQAGFTILGNSGWKASWDNSLDPYVDINFDGIAGNAVFIQKTAEFIQGPVNGFFPSIAIVFEQIAPTTINNIVIQDEIITNSTGVDWTGFRMDVLDHGEVTFNPGATLVSGGPPPIGFGLNPFTTGVFSDGNTRLDIGGGTVFNNTSWNPGGGANDGQLWITVNNLSGNTLFILKETPLPAPGALALLGLAALAGSRRRRA
jgi:MYXO-CTERM domain-containing protein